METTRTDSLFQRAQALFSRAKACYNRIRRMNNIQACVREVVGKELIYI
jgi:hypothetical protein